MALATPLWSLGGIGIYVYDDTEDTAEPVYGQIQVLDATTTILHYAGAKSRVRTIKFHVYGEANWNSLLSAAEADSNVALVSDQGSEGNYRILSLKGDRVQAENYDDIWMDGTAELMKR